MLPTAEGLSEPALRVEVPGPKAVMTTSSPAVAGGYSPSVGTIPSPLMEATGWIEVDGVLRREFRFRNFSEAFAFLTRVAMLAERQNHHPTIINTWNRVTLDLTSHDAGNTVTERDRTLAASIDALLD